MGVEAGYVVVYDLHLLPREVGVLIEDDLVLLAVLWTRNEGTSVREKEPKVSLLTILMPGSWGQQLYLQPSAQSATTCVYNCHRTAASW